MGSSLYIDNNSTQSLQMQLRAQLLEKILNHQYTGEQALPSCRHLSTQLGISRNTVARTYESLCDDGYVISKPKRGYFIHPQYHQRSEQAVSVAAQKSAHHAPDWNSILKKRTANYLTVVKPARWMDYEYPFVYGQLDTDFFPLEHWREAERKVSSNRSDKQWLYDHFDQDHPKLIEQILSQVLPKRGIVAEDHEILLTLGAQNGLSLVSELLLDETSTIGVENPGYREAISTFSLQKAKIMRHEIDNEGIQLTPESKQCDIFYVTPNHQSPTGVSMSNERRNALLSMAHHYQQIIIEDDFDSHISTNYYSPVALKSEDTEGRVIYVGSLSKVISPGLRLGYIVASMEVIDELRALRRLHYRHPPVNIQHHMAHFIRQGHYHSYLNRYNRCSMKRHDILKKALAEYLPQCKYQEHNATAFWIEAPAHVDTQRLAWQAAQFGVLIEPGEIHFFQDPPPKNFFRLGFNAIHPDAIVPGVKKLARAMQIVSG